MVERVSRRTAIALGAALSVTMALTACGGSDSGGSGASSGGVTKVSVGVIPIVDVAPLYLGIQKGFFAKAGLEVSAKPGTGWRGDRAGGHLG
ncbi:MAG: ABC transporter substrate-binding protein [Kineosporiaceae bacterium]|nr:ABC transporter substrate-binding protein [Kineosporiaceae bacterium]